MNYRHAFHAGNFADVVKHVLLTRILAHLARKPTPFRVVDTHAGIGRYDLSGSEAGRTGEWQGGIGRLAEPFAPAVEELLAPYRAVLRATRERFGPDIYPGSPAILRETLRPTDRAVLVEKHPDDAALLAERYGAAVTCKVLALDGWTALKSTIPPRERRGLVFIDPPFEEPDELERAVDRLGAAFTRWPTGILAFWYPVKEPRATDAFARRLGAAIPARILRTELAVGAPAKAGHPSEAGGLAATGLLVVNPPWTLADEARLLLPALADRLGRTGAGTWLCDEIGRAS